MAYFMEMVFFFSRNQYIAANFRMELKLDLVYTNKMNKHMKVIGEIIYIMGKVN